MSSTPITRHLRERADIARALETEAGTPEEKLAMRRLAVHYEIWAERLEQDGGAATGAAAFDTAAAQRSDLFGYIGSRR